MQSLIKLFSSTVHILHRCVATFMARMGQCFSTSTDTIAVVPEETGIEFEDIDDITTYANDQTYTFSDGVGRISQNVARKVNALLIQELTKFSKYFQRRCMILGNS